MSPTREGALNHNYQTPLFIMFKNRFCFLFLASFCGHRCKAGKENFALPGNLQLSTVNIAGFCFIEMMSNTIPVCHSKERQAYIHQRLLT